MAVVVAEVVVGVVEGEDAAEAVAEVVGAEAVGVVGGERGA